MSNYPPGVTGAEPQITGREIRPVAIDTDGCAVWEDVDTGERWNSGEVPTDEERAEIMKFTTDTGISWAPEVLVEGKWAGNAVRFATREEAEESGRELLSRWWVPTDSRAVPSSDPVNYRMVDGRPQSVES